MARKKELPMDEIIEQYKNGSTTTELGKLYGTNPQTISNRLQKEGVQTSSDKGNTQKYGKKNLPVDEMTDLYVNHQWLTYDLAKYYDVSSTTIENRLVNNGISLRTHSEAKQIVMNRPDVKDKTSKASKESSKDRKNSIFITYGHDVASNGLLKHTEMVFDILIETNNKVKHYSRREDAIIKRNQTNLSKYGSTDLMSNPQIRTRAYEGRWKLKSKKNIS